MLGRSGGQGLGQRNQQSVLKDENRADLEARLDEAKAKGTRYWKRKNVKQARKQIKKDLAKLAGVWGRSKKTIAQEGFTNLSKELIQALDMHWGAAYGDMMHFDLRNKGTGKKIAKMRKKV